MRIENSRNHYTVSLPLTTTEKRAINAIMSAEDLPSFESTILFLLSRGMNLYQKESGFKSLSQESISLLDAAYQAPDAVQKESA